MFHIDFVQAVYFFFCFLFLFTRICRIVKHHVDPRGFQFLETLVLIELLHYLSVGVELRVSVMS